MRRRGHGIRIHFGVAALALCLAASAAHAGGALVVQTNGEPYRWSTSGPVPFSPDGGSLGLWSNATAVSNVVEAFNRWGPDLPTSALTFSNAGGIPGDGDVNTASEYLALEGNCGDGISPIVFDANGSLFAALGLPSGLIGFAGPECAISGTITQGLAAINGKWLDGNSANGELTEDEFKGVLVHEFGHFLNLDHAQVNGQYFLGDTDPGFTAFGPPPLSSVEIMFPFAIGGATTPRKDDIATISRLYPASGFSATTGTITGTILYPNGTTAFRGADVIARNAADPYNDAVSNVSGVPYSAPPTVGSYELPGLTSGGSYAVEMVNVRSQFTGASGVGPLDPPAVIPAPEEFYNGVNESSTNPPDNVAVFTSVASSGGVVTAGIDIVMNGTPADLSLTKTDAPDPVAVGQNLTYTLTVTNSGPGVATAVTVTDTLPGGVTYVSATPTQGSCSQASGTVTCTVGTLANGVTRTITIVVNPTTVGTKTNTASVSANESDPNAANNSASAVTTVNPGSADLSVTMNDFPDPVEVGANLSYSATVTNNGPSPATGVTLTDPLPAEVTFVSATPNQGSCSGTSMVTCNLGTLVNGASATVTIVVTPTTAGTITNTVSVSASQSDPAPGNNSASAMTTVESALDNRVINISTRARVQTDDNVMIGGFYIGGSSPKTVLIRARGGSLGGAPFNNPGVLANPTMQLFSGSTVITQNNDWQTTDPLCLSPASACGGEAEITATGLDPCQPNPGQSVAPPGCAQESALYVTLSPGGYTAIVSGVGGTSGMGLVEVFEVDTSPSTLINISTRARVQTGDDVMIGGFYIGGTDPKAVLIRARGGSLGGAPFNNPGVLANPTMQLFSGSTVIAQNNNWQTTDPLCLSPATACGGVPEITATGLDPCQPNPGQSTAPPGCSQETVVLVTLPPGGYTAIVSGVGGTSGMGLVEVFEVP